MSRDDGIFDTLQMVIKCRWQFKTLQIWNLLCHILIQIKHGKKNISKKGTLDATFQEKNKTYLHIERFVNGNACQLVDYQGRLISNPNSI